MDDSTVKISRSELYKEVWTVAITKLSKKYGLSDVGLAKICKKHSIPRPPRGYWARKAAGYKVKRLPLPAGENVTIAITPNPYSRIANKNRELTAKMPPSIQSEEEPIVVPGRLSSPHPLIKQSSEILNGRQPNDVGLINPPKKGCLDIAVSKGSLKRALRIIDTILKVLEKRDYTVYLSEGRTKTKIQEVPISFGISEKLATKKKRPEEHDLNGRYHFGHSRFVEERVPSGDLCLTIHDAGDFYIYGCQQNWNDGKKSKLENRINSFISGLVTVALAKIERDKEKEEEERRRIERQRQFEEERQKRAELRRKYLEEEARVKKLISEAENWKLSQILREYIAEIERLSTAGELSLNLEKPLADWLKWAQDQADRLDPMSPSPSSILDEECPEEENRNEYYHPRW
ncbi:hypothetical protein D1BOALGB6SA_4607 [Olavius sp. associated proteobacterium Delta 1]|nr:hypothetical protein D1BOALGB6SA_4607 [Olavius sp. associated proteobacterium Delta 1]